MIINKNNIIIKLILLTFEEKPYDTCSLWWKTLISFITLMLAWPWQLIIIMRSIVNGSIDYGNTPWIIKILLSIGFALVVYVWIYTWFWYKLFTIWFIWGIATSVLMMVIYGFIYYIDKFFNSLDEDTYQASKPGMITLWWENWKNKTCTKIKYK